jgi:hypothetical protein
MQGSTVAAAVALVVLAGAGCGGRTDRGRVAAPAGDARGAGSPVPPAPDAGAAATACTTEHRLRAIEAAAGTVTLVLDVDEETRQRVVVDRATGRIGARTRLPVDDEHPRAIGYDRWHDYKDDAGPFRDGVEVCWHDRACMKIVPAGALHDDVIHAARIRDDGLVIAIALEIAGAGRVEVWDLITGRRRARFELGDGRAEATPAAGGAHGDAGAALDEEQPEAFDVAFAGDAVIGLATYANARGRVSDVDGRKVWPLAAGARDVVPTGLAAAGPGRIAIARLPPTGPVLAVQSLATGAVERELPLVAFGPQATLFAAGGTVVAYGRDDARGFTVHLVDTAGGQAEAIALDACP